MVKAHSEICILVVMTRPLVLVNTYVKANEQTPFIDPVSKIFIISGLFLGLNRLPVIPNINIVYLILSLLSTFIFTCHNFSFLYSIIYFLSMKLVVGTHFFQWAFVVIFNLVSTKRLKRYYNELNMFDKEVGCRPKIGGASIRNAIVTVVSLVFTVCTFTIPWIAVGFRNIYMGIMPIFLCYILEVHYYGHLLSLLIPRMRLINYYMELSLTSQEIKTILGIEGFEYLKADYNKELCEMEKVKGLYHTMIKSHNYLVEAIKWQLLVTIISTFFVILVGTYQLSLYVIKGNMTLISTFSFLVCSGTLVLTLFSPCILGDQVHYEVRRLRELLAARIYENQMDRSSRCLAHVLLAWTEKRDLSFSLLRVLNIDISLPFKFVGLLVTYLIILLQFQKVMNP